jgi:hypothetical protein
VRDALESFRVSATGRWAVSIRSYILTVPFAIAINLERENILNPNDVASSLAICLTGEFASYLYLFLAQATLLKHRRERLQRLSTCIFVWFSAGTVKGVFFVLYAVIAFGYDPDFLARTIVPTLFSGFSGALLAFYFGTIDRRRIESKALISLGDFLEVDQQVSHSDNEILRMKAIRVLRETLAPQLEKLEASLASLSHANNESEDSFTLLAKESAELGDQIEVEAQIILKSEIKEAPEARRYPREISLLTGLIPQVISVRVTLVVYILGMTSGQITRNGALGVASGLVGAVILGAVVFSLRVFSKKLRGRKRTRIILVSFPIVFLTQMFYVSNLSNIGFNLDDPYIPWYSALKTIYGFYLASIIASLIVDTSSEFKFALNESDKIQGRIAIQENEQEALNRHLFATRFGALQGKITGVTMALQLLSNESSEFSDTKKNEELLSGAISILRDARLEIAALGRDYRGA